jgi:hypothetical protein
MGLRPAAFRHTQRATFGGRDRGGRCKRPDGSVRRRRRSALPDGRPGPRSSPRPDGGRWLHAGDSVPPWLSVRALYRSLLRTRLRLRRALRGRHRLRHRPERFVVAGMPSESMRGPLRGGRARRLRGGDHVRRLPRWRRLRGDAMPARGPSRLGRCRPMRGPFVHAGCENTSLRHGDRRVWALDGLLVRGGRDVLRRSLRGSCPGVRGSRRRSPLLVGAEHVRQCQRDVRQLSRGPVRPGHVHDVRPPQLRQAHLRQDRKPLRRVDDVRHLRLGHLLRGRLLQPVDLRRSERRRAYGLRAGQSGMWREQVVRALPGRQALHESRVYGVRSEDLQRLRRRRMRTRRRLRQDAQLLRGGHDVPRNHLLCARRGRLRGKLLFAFVRPEPAARSAGKLRAGHRVRAGPEGPPPLRAGPSPAARRESSVRLAQNTEVTEGFLPCPPELLGALATVSGPARGERDGVRGWPPSRVLRGDRRGVVTNGDGDGGRPAERARVASSRQRGALVKRARDSPPRSTRPHRCALLLHAGL